MDIARPDLLLKRKRRFVVLAVAALLIVAVGLIAVFRLKPAAPTVDRSTIWPDTVKRGPMIRQVRGSTGTLVPREDKLRLIPAETEATVTRILVLPGAQVQPNTVIMDLSYPQLDQEALNASLALKAAESDYHNTQIKLQSDLMTQKAGAATVSADFSQANLQAQTDKALFDLGVISGLTYKASQSKANELTTRNQIENDRLAMNEQCSRRLWTRRALFISSNRSNWPPCMSPQVSPACSLTCRTRWANTSPPAPRWPRLSSPTS
jgi:multidrug efflux pump subunit AcrA (membrane-fusion protein)